MKKFNTSGAGSLCAAVLAFALILLSFPVVPASAAGTELLDEQGYKYAVTIEFGPMTFCYDYGKWNVDEMRYRSDDASSNPANGTVQGYPGWYGFDGTANRISVKYTNANNEQDFDSDGIKQNRKLSVSLDYRMLTTSDNVSEEVTGVSMDFFSDKELTTKFTFDNDTSKTFTVPHTDIGNDDKTVLYASLRGVPKIGTGNYMSDTFTPIGMLTIRIGELSD